MQADDLTGCRVDGASDRIEGPKEQTVITTADNPVGSGIEQLDLKVGDEILSVGANGKVISRGRRYRKQRGSSQLKQVIVNKRTAGDRVVKRACCRGDG